MITVSIQDKHKTDHLFLLIGTNPLPNYVAALLLTHQKSKIHLLYSDGSDGTPSTLGFANNLKRAIEGKYPNLTVIPHGIHESDSQQIEKQINKILFDEKNPIKGSIGLNYTGGTKPMSVHSYRTLLTHSRDVVFSYLDARTLMMCFDDFSSPYYVGRSVDLSLEELIELHDYELKEKSLNKSRPLVLLEALAEIHQTDDGMEQWRKWCSTLSPDNKVQLPDPEVYSHLRPVWNASVEICADIGEPTPEAVSMVLGFPSLVSASKWFIGKWLEEWSLTAIVANAAEFEIKYYAQGLKPTPRGEISQSFDLDAAAMIGYQLFAVSCIASRGNSFDRETTNETDPQKNRKRKKKNERGEVKKHLFEAYVRARQLGGDEARVAVVSCLDNPESLQAEVERDWHVRGQIRVFGRHHLIQLDSAFREWFKTAT